MINADDMQSWAYLLAPTFQFVNTAGKPLTEGWLEVYIAGTRNKYYCASDFNGTLHPFQIPLDSLGANIVLADPSQAYDVYAYNKFGSLIMSRYHVTPVGAGGSSSVLNIVISSEDGTVTVNSDGNGNFDLSIQDTVDRVEALEDAISHINDNITVGYAIGHANTVNLDNTINLVNDGVSGIDYLQDMTGYRLKPGHVYQFNYNAKFECGEHDQYCSGKFYLEGADTVAQEWLFNLDDSYYHSECFNGSTVLVTPNNLAYYDIQLKYAWDVDYANKPDIDLNKISIVDITSIINSTGEGGGTYTAGDGIVINDTTNVISVDMDYINSHLDIDATEIIASAVNIATAYTNTVSGDIINYIDGVSGNLVDLISDVTGTIPEQVNADWNAVSGKAEILNKPDLSVYATHSEVSAVSGNLVNYVNSVSGDLVNYVDSVSGDIVNYVDESIVSAIDVISGIIPEAQVQSNWTETDDTDPSYIQNKPVGVELVAGQNIGIFSDDTTITIAASGSDLSDYATHSEVINSVTSVSSVLQNEIDAVSAAIPVVTGFATVDTVNTVSSILEQEIQTVSAAIPDVSDYATHTEVNNAITAVTGLIPTDYVTHNEVSAVSGNLVNYVDESVVSAINVISGIIPEAQEQADWTETDNTEPSYIKNKPDLSVYTTHTEVSAIASAYASGGGSAQVNSDWNATSGVAEILNKPAVSGLVAGQNISITASGSNYVISSTVTGGGGSGVNYNAGDHIDITNDTISVTGITELVAGTNVTITMNGDSAVISSAGGQQVQADWDEADSSSPAYIQNKPSIPQDPEQSDWNETDPYSLAYIKNKPNISEAYTGASGIAIDNSVISLDEPLGIVAGSGINIVIEGDSAIICVSGVTGGGGSGTNYQAGYGINIANDTISVNTSVIPNVSTVSAIVEAATGSIPTPVQVNSDWNATSGVAEILNKPTEANLLAGSGISFAASGSDIVINTTPIELVAALPANPVSGVLYLIPEA